MGIVINHCDVSLLNSCNYHCDYCKSGSLHSRQNNDAGVFDVNGPVLEADTLIDFVWGKLGGHVIQLSGGEPLTHPSFGYILSEISKTNKVIVCTNGSLIHKYKKFLSNNNIVWRISYHPEYRKDDFDCVMNLVVNSCAKYIVNYVCHPRHIENGKVFEYMENIKTYNHTVSEFDGNYKNVNYRLISDIYEGICTPLKDVTFDLNMVVIKPNGLIYSCHGQTENSIGNIYTGDYNGYSCKMKCKVSNKSLCQTYSSVSSMIDYNLL